VSWVPNDNLKKVLGNQAFASISTVKSKKDIGALVSKFLLAKISRMDRKKRN
jgi:hypothetical protein